MRFMGIYDRDYYRSSLPRGGFGYFSAWSVTTWLIVINISVLFADGIVHRLMAPHRPVDAEEYFLSQSSPQDAISQMGVIERWGYFSVDKAIYHGQIWRFLTFQFLHASPLHLIVNMIGLFFFGPIVESHFGHRRYLAFYLLCGMSGAVCFALLAWSRIVPVESWEPMVGASAGIFGVLIGAAMIAPDVQLFYYFFPVTVRMVAIVAMLMAAYAVFVGGGNPGGEAAHLGGGAMGFVFMKNQQWLNPFGPRRQWANVGTARRKRRVSVGQKDWSKDFNR